MSTLHQIVLLVGVAGVPITLLVAGHRLRRESVRRQRAFWGAIVGHVVACVAALFASLSPPIGWLGTDLLRGALGVWGLVVLPLIGAAFGSFTRSSH
jgi:hypothetical protein